MVRLPASADARASTCTPVTSSSFSSTWYPVLRMSRSPIFLHASHGALKWMHAGLFTAIWLTTFPLSRHRPVRRDPRRR